MLGFGTSWCTACRKAGAEVEASPTALRPPSQGLDGDLLSSQGSRAPSIGAGGLVGESSEGSRAAGVRMCRGFWVAASSCLTGQVCRGLQAECGGPGELLVSRDSGGQTGVSAGLG